jgi:hypothetical protein
VKKNGIGFGIFLITLGIIFFLIQYGIIDKSIFYYIEEHKSIVIALVLIVIGINIVFRKYAFARAVTWVGFLAVLIMLSHNYQQNVPAEDYGAKPKFVHEKRINTEKAKMKLVFAAISLRLDSTASNLYEGTSEGIDVVHEVEYKDDNKTAKITFKQRSQSLMRVLDSFISSGKANVDRKAELYLNDDIIWNMDLSLDAFDSSLNMSGLKIEALSIEGNAGNINLILGNKQDIMKVNIEANAASVKISVPQNTGVKLSLDASLGSNSFKRIEMIRRDGYYISQGYEEAESKIDIKAEVNAGTLEIIGIE